MFITYKYVNPIHKLYIIQDRHLLTKIRTDITLLLHGMAMSTYLAGESVLHRAMTGMLT